MTRLPVQARRGAALALLLLPVLALAWAGYCLEQARRDSLATIAGKRELLGRLVQMGRRSEALGSALDAARGHPGRAWFLAGESEALITAQLQQRVQEIVAAQGGQFLRAGEAEPRTIDGQDYRGLRIGLSGSIESLQRILIDLESGVPYLFITRAQLAADQSGGDERAPSQLALELDLHGAVLAPVSRP